MNVFTHETCSLYGKVIRMDDQYVIVQKRFGEAIVADDNDLGICLSIDDEIEIINGSYWVIDGRIVMLLFPTPDSTEESHLAINGKIIKVTPQN